MGRFKQWTQYNLGSTPWRGVETNLCSFAHEGRGLKKVFGAHDPSSEASCRQFLNLTSIKMHYKCLRIVIHVQICLSWQSTFLLLWLDSQIECRLSEQQGWRSISSATGHHFAKEVLTPLPGFEKIQAPTCSTCNHLTQGRWIHQCCDSPDYRHSNSHAFYCKMRAAFSQRLKTSPITDALLQCHFVGCR